MSKQYNITIDLDYKVDVINNYFQKTKLRIKEKGRNEFYVVKNCRMLFITDKTIDKIFRYVLEKACKLYKSAYEIIKTNDIEVKFRYANKYKEYYNTIVIKSLNKWNTNDCYELNDLINLCKAITDKNWNNEKFLNYLPRLTLVP